MSRMCFRRRGGLLSIASLFLLLGEGSPVTAAQDEAIAQITLDVGSHIGRWPLETRLCLRLMSKLPESKTWEPRVMQSPVIGPLAQDRDASGATRHAPEQLTLPMRPDEELALFFGSALITKALPKESDQGVLYKLEFDSRAVSEVSAQLDFELPPDFLLKVEGASSLPHGNSKWNGRGAPRLESLPPGPARVGLYFEDGSLLFSLVELSSGQQSVSLEPRQTGRLTGRVMRSDGRPAGRVVVEAVSRPGSSVTE